MCNRKNMDLSVYCIHVTDQFIANNWIACASKKSKPTSRILLAPSNKYDTNLCIARSHIVTVFD